VHGHTIVVLPLYVPTPPDLYKIPIINNGLADRADANCLRPLRKGEG
jgi:hypothetical protein